MASHWSRTEVREFVSKVKAAGGALAGCAGFGLTRLGIVDNVLDDCFQLVSLFFLTIGRNNEAPAVYVLGDVSVNVYGSLS